MFRHEGLTQRPPIAEASLRKFEGRPLDYYDQGAGIAASTRDGRLIKSAAKLAQPLTEAAMPIVEATVPLVKSVVLGTPLQETGPVVFDINEHGERVPAELDDEFKISEPKKSKFDKVNKALRTDNGNGRQWYNWSDENLPSSNSPLIEGTAYALRINGGQAPLEEVARIAEQPADKILELQSLDGSIKVFPSEDGELIVSCPPLQAFMAEKGLLKTPHISAGELHTAAD